LLEANEIHQNSTRLARLAATECQVLVKRDTGVFRVSSLDLVPGDILVLESDMDVPCDLTLLQGSVLVNEASLTGESCPVRKSPWHPALTELHSDEDREESESSSESEADSGPENDEIISTHVAGASLNLVSTSLLSSSPEGFLERIVHEANEDESRAALDSFEDTLYEHGDFMQGETKLDFGNETAGSSSEMAANGTHVNVGKKKAIEGADAWSKSEHMAYAGTWIMEARDDAFGVVVRTGVSTLRGELVRDIIVDGGSGDSVERMHHEAFVAIGLLFLVGSLCGYKSYYVLHKVFGISRFESMLDALDVLTIAVPPALPATITFGLVFALARLQAKQILCVRSSCVSRAAWLRVICFDKTGTLTEEGLDIRALRFPTATAVSDQSAVKENSEKTGKKSNKNLSLVAFAKVWNAATDARGAWPRDVERVMAACHSLSRVSGEIVGDEVDIRLFELSGWKLHLPRVGPSSVGSRIKADRKKTERTQAMFEVIDEESDERLSVIRLLDFNSEMARMGVVARLQNMSTEDQNVAKLFVFVKGAPEIIAMKCKRSSVPADLHDVLAEYAQQGLRVLGLACRELTETESEIRKMPRAKLEKDLKFAGLVILENRLKSDTSQVIRELSNRGGLRTLMITGDHSRTAISVARQCGILSSTSSVIVSDVEEKPSKVPSKSKDNPVRAAEFLHGVCFVDMKDPSKKLSSSEVLARLGAGSSPSSMTTAPSAELVLTGAAFRKLDEEFTSAMNPPSSLSLVQTNREQILALFKAVLTHGSVFARMSASDKSRLVNLLRSEIDPHVGMCGDGANDAAALKEASVGISLCEGIDADATASLAAPLTSRKATIRAVLDTVLEGRAAAAASLSAFRFMFLYSSIQLFSVLLLYFVGSTYGDGQFLFVDLCLIIPLGILMGKTQPSKYLGTQAPPASLSSQIILLSTFSQTLIQLLFQLLTIKLIHNISGLQLSFSEMQELTIKHAEPWVLCADNSALFLVSNFQYIWTCVAFNIGRPFRVSIFTNRAFFFMICTLSALCFLLLWLLTTEVGSLSWFGKALQIEVLPNNLRVQLVFVVIGNLLASLFAENLLIVFFFR